MSTINERIAFLIKDQGLTQAKFAEIFHFGQSNVSKICNGTVTPTEGLIDRICEKFNVSLVWLQTGEGEPYVKRDKNDELTYLVTRFMEEADDSFQKRFVAALLELPPEFWPELQKFIKKIAQDI